MLIPLLLACTASGTDTAGTTKTTTADAGTLSSVQAETFTPSCAFSSCHAATNPAGGLDLTDGNAYAALVNKPSTDADGETLVVPNDSAASYLIKKCTGGADFVGDLMPQGSTTGLDAARLSNLAAWIDAGAADD